MKNMRTFGSLVKFCLKEHMTEFLHFLRIEEKMRKLTEFADLNDLEKISIMLRFYWQMEEQ